MKINNKENRDYYTKLAADYENLNDKVVMKNAELHEKLLEAIDSNETQEVRILDLGFGTGELIRMILEKYRNTSVVGVDFSTEMSDVAHAKLTDLQGRYELVNQDLKNADLESLGMFDVVISSMTIHNFAHSEKKDLLEKIHTVLEDTGMFINGDFILAENPEEQPAMDAQYKEFLEMNLEGEILENWLEHAFSYDQPMKFSQQSTIMKEIGFKEIEETWSFGNEMIYRAKK